MKALEKDRTRRYGSASELAADLKHHLANEPVSAGPPSAGYRARKFVRRHRLAVATASVVLVSILVGLCGRHLRARPRGPRRAEGALRGRDHEPDQPVHDRDVRDQQPERGARPLDHRQGDPGPRVRAHRRTRWPTAPRRRRACSRRWARSIGASGCIRTSQPLLESAVESQKAAHGEDSAEVAATMATLGGPARAARTATTRRSRCSSAPSRSQETKLAPGRRRARARPEQPRQRLPWAEGLRRGAAVPRGGARRSREGARARSPRRRQAARQRRLDASRARRSRRRAPRPRARARDLRNEARPQPSRRRAAARRAGHHGADGRTTSIARTSCWQRVISIKEANMGKDHPELVVSLVNLGVVAAGSQGPPRRRRRRCGAPSRSPTAKFDPTNRDAVNARQELAITLRAEGKDAEAVAVEKGGL